MSKWLRGLYPLLITLPVAILAFKYGRSKNNELNRAESFSLALLHDRWAIAAGIIVFCSSLIGTYLNPMIGDSSRSISKLLPMLPFTLLIVMIVSSVTHLIHVTISRG